MPHPDPPFMSRDRGQRHRRRLLILMLVLGMLLTLMVPAARTQAAPPHGERVSRSGWLTVNWGDARSGSSTVVYSLNPEGQEEVQVLIDDVLARRHGGLAALNRSRVTVRGRWVRPEGFGSAVIRAEAIEAADDPTSSSSSLDSSTLSGSQPWINVLCKFADVSSEPHSPSYFDGLIGETEPGLGHFWREASYESINLLGSGSSGWYTLPETRSYYLNLGSSQMLDELFEDCTAAADSAVDYTQYMGINLMFNDELDGAAWGGSQHATLDGETRFWAATWEPPWAYDNQAVVGHEMGHGFGLPHSSGTYGLTYDNQWDVMSDVWTNCARSSDPTYGCLGQHTIAFHKDRVGWIPDAQLYQAVDGVQTITLERLALPQTDHYRLAVISIEGSTSNFYTVEARNWAGYDVKLPGEAVIIHEVDTTRSRPAHVLDVDGDGDTGDEGAMWTVGETFTDSEHKISVAVDSATTSGYTVTITLGDAPPTETPTDTPEPTSTPTETPTNTPSSTPTDTPTSTKTPTATATDTLTPTSTDTPEPTDTPSPTSTHTPEPTHTLTSTATDTPSPTSTDTPEPTDTPSPTSTDTPEPATTNTATATDTPEPTATHTPTPTDTPSPTTTATPEPTETPSPTSTPTSEPTDTLEPTHTPTSTATDTPEPTATSTPTATNTPVATDTPPATDTDTPVPTDTYTPEATSTHTPQPTATCPPSTFHESKGKPKGRFGEAPPFTYGPQNPCFQPPGQRPPVPGLLEQIQNGLGRLQNIFARLTGR